MGIVNVTPDSFSDGGRFLDADAAVEHGLALASQGAHILDVGGESTRPGAQPVDAQEELRRVVPVIERLARADTGAQISVDTSKAVVARAALAAGAGLVNDVTALRGDPEMAATVADAGVECCLMHMLGEPRTMQADPRYEDVVDEVKAFLEERLAFAVRAGIAEERILLDPGIGFGKTVAHNVELLRRLEEIVALGRPVMVGTSRKSFIERLARASGPADIDRPAEDPPGDDNPTGPPSGGENPTGRPPGGENPTGRPAGGGNPTDLLPGTIATNVMALERGATVFRVHDVMAVALALSVAAATLGGGWTAQSAPMRTSPTS